MMINHFNKLVILGIAAMAAVSPAFVYAQILKNTTIKTEQTTNLLSTESSLKSPAPAIKQPALKAAPLIRTVLPIKKPAASSKIQKPKILTPSQSEARVNELKRKADELQKKALENITNPERPVIKAKMPDKKESTASSRSNLESAVDKIRGIKKEAVSAAKNSYQTSLPQEKLLSKQKEDLLNIAEALRAYLEVVKKQISGLPVANTALQNAIAAEIESETAKLDSIETAINAAKNPGELALVAGELRLHRKEATEQRLRKLMLLAHLEAFEHHALATTVSRVEMVISSLAKLPSGKKTILLESNMAEVKSKLNKTKGQFIKLRNDIVASDITETKFKNVKTEFGNLQQEINAIYRLLLSASQNAKGL